MGNYRPTVIAHGMGDSGTNKGMVSLCKTVSEKYPGSYVLCSTTADGGASMGNSFTKQLADFTAEVRSKPELAKGFNAVGLSQGNFLLESYIALVNQPPVFNFVSICGPLQGEATCPKNIAFDMICPVCKLNPYGALAFSSYWKGTKDKDTYLKKSKMIEPRESEQYGMWQWGTTGKNAPIVALRDSEGYQGDWMGLKTLDAQGKLHNSSFVGEHIRFSSEYWDATVLPYLGNTFD